MHSFFPIFVSHQLAARIPALPLFIRFDSAAQSLTHTVQKKVHQLTLQQRVSAAFTMMHHRRIHVWIFSRFFISRLRIFGSSE